MPETDCRYEDALASCAECPECHTPVIAYESGFDAVTSYEDEEEPLKLVCDRCGTSFEMTEDDLLLRSIPMRWLLAYPPMAN